MNMLPSWPSCQSEYTYKDGELLICPTYFSIKTAKPSIKIRYLHYNGYCF